MTTTPIADLALLSDRHSSALVDRQGTVQWLCFPRFDSPSVFAQLLDERAGFWQIRPAGRGEDLRTERRYVDETLVLETTFRTSTGVLVLTDALHVGDDPDPHRLGTAAPHLLIRRLACVDGRVDVDVRLAARPEYGQVVPLLSAVPDGVTIRGGAEHLVLSCPVDVVLSDAMVNAALHLDAGEVVHLGLHRSSLHEAAARTWSQQELHDALESTVKRWRAWSQAHQFYDGPWKELVWTSGRVLQALSFAPTGAIIAAPTTSLPEGVGGGRTWDYRFSWVRDASFTMEALWVAACPDEAVDFFSFMTTAAATLRPERGLQIMFGVGGEHDLSERSLDHLSGWRASRPVRVGNGAWNQQQIDVYGELLGAASRLSEQLVGMDDATRGFLIACADTAAARWREPDQGIWEIRGEPRHFLYSKLMCWAALDRAVSMADLLHAHGRVEGWTRVRDEIRSTVLQEGWSQRAGAFTQYFGSDDLDASALMIPIVGFLTASDPRMLATIDAIADRLTDERGLVYRYRAENGVDGLAGDEGTFLLCTFWLAQALAESGQLDRATEVFTLAASFRNDLGLLSEEVDASSGELLGNFPQAFSHIGLVNAAWSISEGYRRVGTQRDAQP